ncbi:neprilysin-11-like [Microplitis mediator]|uniref:neprilysin-11-like n=1 Tax=Microplitis mediator TaxID=375433 RepID=UPI0025544227|nr:neprilysin-11-like [Microplitis mediator]
MISKLILFLALNAALYKNASGGYGDSVLNQWLFNAEENNEKKPAVCETPECKIIAKDFSEGMNKSVDPCDDFYEYVCGGWNNPEIIPSWETSWSVFQQYQLMVFTRIKEILETKPEPDDILPVRQAKKWYRSCMDTDTLEKRGLKPIESILMQVGGWPMIIDAEEWDENEHSWERIEHYYFDITGNYTFHSIDPMPDDFIEEARMRKSKSRFLVDTEYDVYLEDEVKAYANFIKGVVSAFIKHNSAKISKKTIQKDIRNLIKFELALRKLDDEYDEMSIGDFLEEYNEGIEELDSDVKKINFQDIFNGIFGLIDHKINESTMITIATPSYYVQLTELLNKTHKRTIVNYIHWNFVRDMLQYTTKEMRSLKSKLEDTVYEASEKKPRWLECTEEMKMIRAAAYAFVDKFYTADIDKSVHEMTENIRKELEELIERTSWMDEESKRLSKKKLNSMKVFIGFPDWYRNRTAVTNSYKGLLIGSHLFDNVLSYKKYEKKKEYQNAVDPDADSADPDTEIDPIIVNAFYTPEENIVELPAANFQPPLFTSQLPRNVNYGMQGTGIGHEMGHGFDDDGIKFGENGSDTEISHQMLSLYYKRAECFLDQYNDLAGETEPFYEGLLRYLFNYKGNSFGGRTRGENIADVTGIQSVFEAYLKTSEKEGPDNKLPGFEDFTDNQMFFISFASAWCEVATPEKAEENFEGDSHSPGRLRVIGSVSNTDGFAKEFNCPKGSPMNPENKCTIWSTEPKRTSNRKSKLRKRKHWPRQW